MTTTETRETFIPLTDHHRRVIFIALHALAAGPDTLGQDGLELEELGRYVLGFLEMSA